MSYRVVYEKGGSYRKYKKSSGSWKMSWILLSVTIVACILLFGIINTPKDMLFPGNPQITGQALDHMVDNIGNGESLSDAFAAFCKEIVSDGKIR